MLICSMLQVPNYVAEAWKQADGHELGRLTLIEQGDGQVMLKNDALLKYCWDL